MRTMCISLLLFVPLLTALVAQEGQPPAQRLLIAFSSYRDRPKHAQVYFYEHDGVAKGKIVGAIDTIQNRQDYHPILSRNGMMCVFASELENQTSKIFVYDMTQKKIVTPAKLNVAKSALLHPTIDGLGKIIAFAAWDKTGAGQRWDIDLFDLPEQKPIVFTGLNQVKSDERMPALSADGRWLAFVSNMKGGLGGPDIYLYDRKESRTISLPEINSPFVDITPSLNADGNLIAFASDRATGMGGRDIYLYDRAIKRFLPLPGVNSIANEQSPNLSPDGRYLAFVSERIKGEGERDIFVYDRVAQKLMPAPGLNSRREDMDPCVIVVE